MAINIWTEIIYDNLTKKVITTQQFDHDRGNDHDWNLTKDQVLVRINKALPNEDISNKQINTTLDDIEIDPSYISVDDKKQAEIDTINNADTITKLQAILLQMIEDKYI